MYYVEMTDTFSGELNYSWVKRYIVKAKTLKACMRKVAIETGYNARMRWRIGQECAMYKVRGNCIGYSVNLCVDEMTERYTNEKHKWYISCKQL